MSDHAHLQSSECLEPILKRSDKPIFPTDLTVSTASMTSGGGNQASHQALQEETVDIPLRQSFKSKNDENDDEIAFQSFKGFPASTPLIEESGHSQHDLGKEEDNDDDGEDFHDSFSIEAVTIRMPPPPPSSPPTSGVAPPKRLSGRTESTQNLLRRQGFTALQRMGSVKFAVRSTRRGSHDWQSLISPFVADLAFRSLVRARHFAEPHFRPYLCHAAVLFVDLSGYSRITSALAHNGAHAVSAVVNAYLEQLLHIIRRFGGDVVKFAGDAVLVVWEGTKEELAMNVLAAAECVVTLQRDAGVHPIEGTDLKFRIHCGLACGELDSEVFEAPTHVNMQRLYHSVGGGKCFTGGH